MANIYFGNVRKAQYIPAPKAGMDAASTGFTESLNYLNGGGYVAQSVGGSRKFAMSWDVTPKTSLDCLNQYRNGEFGSGLIYWVDPFSDNPVPPHWGTPMLSGMGWPSLVGSAVQPTLAPTVFTRINLIPNPSAEVDVSGWTASSTTVTRSTAWSSSGSASFAITNTGNANTGDMRIAGAGAAQMPAGFTPGKTYTVSATINKTAADTGNFSRTRRILIFISTNGSNFTENFGPQVPNVTGPQRISHTFTIPANATGMLIGIGAASQTTGQLTYADSIMAEESNTLGSYFDGGPSFPGSSWVGTANASFSVWNVPATQYNIPYQSAVYSVNGPIGVAPSRKLTMLVPPDKGLRIGFTGSAVNAGVYLQLVNLDGTLVAPQLIPVLSAGDNQLTNVFIPGYLYKAAFFYLAPTAVGGGTVTLASVDARYGSIVESDPIFGNYVSGDGHTGCRMSDVTWVYVQAANNRKLVTAATTLTEIGAWL